MNYSIMIESLPTLLLITHLTTLLLYTHWICMRFMCISYLVWIEKKQEAYFFWKIKKGIIKKCRRNFTFVFLVVFFMLKRFFPTSSSSHISFKFKFILSLLTSNINSHQHSSSLDLSSTGCLSLCFLTCLNRVSFPSTNSIFVSTKFHHNLHNFN